MNRLQNEHFKRETNTIPRYKSVHELERILRSWTQFCTLTFQQESDSFACFCLFLRIDDCAYHGLPAVKICFHMLKMGNGVFEHDENKI